MKRMRAVVAALLMAVGTVTAGPVSVASAEAAPPTVTFERGFYMTAVDSAFSSPVRVTVTDELGAPVAGATVDFTVVPDSLNGASVNLSLPAVVTDASGTAQVQASAGPDGGRAWLKASIDGVVRSGVWMWMRPPGFRAGEQVASVVAEDQDGVTRNIGDTVHKGTYTIIDTCAGWCGPCREYAKQLRDASALLAADYKVDLQIVTLLQQGTDPTSPSTRADAQAWKSSLGLTNTVLHAGGSYDSEAHRASEFFLLDGDELSPSVPTSLLVGPDGVIVDRLIGAQPSVDAVVQRVLDAGAKAHRPKVVKEKKARAGDRVTATIDGQTTSAVFAVQPDSQFQATPLGTLAYLSDDTDPSIAVRDIGFAVALGEPLPAAGALGLSLTRLDSKEAKEPLSSTTLPLFLVALRSPGDWDHQVVVETSVPATSAKGVTSVALDLAGLRVVLRDRLEAGDYSDSSGSLGDLGAADIDALVANLTFVDVQATFLRQ